MIDPAIEVFNGTTRPMMLVTSNSLAAVPSESIIEPGQSLVLFDQRQKLTTMFRELTDEEMDKYIEAKLEREKDNDKR